MVYIQGVIFDVLRKIGEMACSTVSGNARGHGTKADGSNVVQEEPEFIRRLKQQGTGAAEAAADARAKQIRPDFSSSDEEDEQPEVVVLKSRHLTREQAAEHRQADMKRTEQEESVNLAPHETPILPDPQKPSLQKHASIGVKKRPRTTPRVVGAASPAQAERNPAAGAAARSSKRQALSFNAEEDDE